MTVAPSAAPSAAPLPRHTQVWLAADAHKALRATATDAEVRTVLRLWRRRAHPLIVRRDTQEADNDNIVAVGLPLPPSRDKRRLAFRVARAEIARHAPPLLLADVIVKLPSATRAPLVELDRDARALGAELRVFGAFAWQALTGLAYVRPASDLDLILRPGAPEVLSRTLSLFTRWESRHGRAIDAEIAFTEDAGVQWREWRDAARNERVLVKSLRGPRLVACASLLACLSREAA